MQIDVPIIVLTGNRDTENWERCLRFGAKHIFHKPTPAREIGDAIEAVLRGI